MTTRENERLAVVETKIEQIATQITSISSTLEMLVEYSIRGRQREDDGDRTTAFRRWLIPITVTLGMTAVNVAMALGKG